MLQKQSRLNKEVRRKLHVKIYYIIIIQAQGWSPADSYDQASSIMTPGKKKSSTNGFSALERRADNTCNLCLPECDHPAQQDRAP